MDNKLTLNYKITSDPRFFDEENAISPELSIILEKFYELATAGRRSAIPKLLKAIEEYPENPQLKNYLSVLYGQINNFDKMYEINHRIVDEHPNYLFGKINLAHEYIKKGEVDKVVLILGETLDLKALYPERDTFHINEVLSFHKCLVFYFTAIGNIDQAQLCYDLMENIAPDAADVEIAFKYIFTARMEAGYLRYKEEQENKISVKVEEQQKTKIKKPPSFTHSEIKWLYSYDFNIEEEKIYTLLQLPRESLIKDLELVLEDSINRYTFFSEEEGWDEEKMSFPIHAIFLLGELEAEESINVLFKVLSQSEEYISFYFGGLLTDVLWEPTYKMVNRNIDACKEFLTKPGIDTYTKALITDVFEQIVHHQPNRRNEIIACFRDVINFFLSSSRDANVIDSEFIGLFICNIMDFKGQELLPEIEQLYDKKYVSYGICGSFEDVKEDIEGSLRQNTNRKYDFLSMVERYNEITTWESPNDDYSSFYNENYTPVETFTRSEPKIGRNDLCPCGSGKKYKKCCMNK